MTNFKYKKTLIPFFISLSFSACSYKYDITEKTIIPKQAESKASYDYRTMEHIIKNTKTWSKDLENKTLKFNLFVEDTLNEIDSKKRYLAKIYNVQYYDFDKDGFNKGQATEVKKEPSNTKNKQDNITSSKSNKNSIKNSVVKEEAINKTQNNQTVIIENKKEATTTNNKVNKNDKNNNTLYDSQIFKEYNF